MKKLLLVFLLSIYHLGNSQIRGDLVSSIGEDVLIQNSDITYGVLKRCDSNKTVIWSKQLFINTTPLILEDETIYASFATNIASPDPNVLIDNISLKSGSQYLGKFDGKTGKLLKAKFLSKVYYENIYDEFRYKNGFIYASNHVSGGGSIVKFNTDLKKIDSSYYSSYSSIKFINVDSDDNYYIQTWPKNYAGKCFISQYYKSQLNWTVTIPHFDVYCIDNVNNQLLTLNYNYVKMTKLILNSYDLSTGTFIKADSSIAYNRNVNDALDKTTFNLKLDKENRLWFVYNNYNKLSYSNITTLRVIDLVTFKQIDKFTYIPTGSDSPVLQTTWPLLELSITQKSFWISYAEGSYPYVYYKSIPKILTGFEDLSQQSSIRVYAANQQLHVNLESSVNYSIIICDLKGQIFYQSNILENSIDLLQGVYIVKIVNNNQILSNKFVIQ